MLNLKYYKLKQQFKKELSQLPYKLSIANSMLLYRFYQRYGEEIFKYLKDKNIFLEQIKELENKTNEEYNKDIIEL